jgi:tetratricopeptide (TPR) repeat protein
MRFRRLLAWGALVACLAFAGSAFAQQAELDKGRAAYIAHRYEDAERIFAQMFANGAPPQAPGVVAEGRMYWGATLVALGRKDDAERIFHDLLRDAPSYSPDPVIVAADAVNLFEDTKAKYTAELNAAEERRRQDAEAARVAEQKRREEEARRLQRLQELAAEEQTTIFHSRWIALLPYGIGQFQNGDKGLGFLFLSVEASLTAASVVTWATFVAYRSDADQAYNTGRYNDYLGYISRDNDWRTANLVVDGILAGVAVIGIVEAEIAYKPALVNTRARPVPAVKLLPTLRPARQGGILGIEGKF